MILPEPNIKDHLTAADVIQSNDAPPQITEDAELTLVIRDAERAEGFVNEQQWVLYWKEADLLYQSPRKLQAWENTTVTRANTTRFKVASHVQSIIPKLTGAIFFSDPPFLLRPRPGITQDTVRAKTAVFSAMLEDIGFRQEVGKFFFSVTLKGTGIAKWGWTSEKKKCKKYVRKAQDPEVDLPVIGKKKLHTKQSEEFQVEEYTEDVEKPFFETCQLAHVLVDPGNRCSDIRKSKYVIHKLYMTLEDLECLRDQPGYYLPSKEELAAIYDPVRGETAVSVGPNENYPTGQAMIHHAVKRSEQTTLDPMKQTLEVLERWDNDKVITVLNRKICIRNEQNEFGCIPFLSSNWWDIEDAFYGIGVGHIVGQEQRVEQGVVNAALDTLALSLNQQYVRNRGANVPTQNIRQRLGGIIDVDGDVDKALRLLEVPRIPPEVWTTIQASNAAAESASGANELLVQGSMPSAGRTSMGRTATGASNMAGASESRLQTPLDMFVNQVFEPFIQTMDELINERMPTHVLRQILGQELGQDFEFNPTDYLNAKLKYEVLAGTHLQAKRAMAQSLPLMIQIFENQTLLQQLQQTGYTVDVNELFQMIMETSEWKNSRNVIRPLNDQEKQSMQAMNPQAQQLQGKMALQQQSQAAKSAQLDSENYAKAGRDVLRQVFDKSSATEAEQGEPSSNQGVQG